LKFALTFLFCLTAVNSSGLAADIKVLSVGTVSSALRDLIPQFERESGNKIQISYGNPATVLERLSQGEAADVVMVGGALWEQAEKLERLNPESKTIIPATPYAIGMKIGTKSSEPVTINYFKHLVEEAKSIALVDRSPSTTLLMQSLGKLGVASQAESKTKIYPTGGAIAEALAHAEVDMGITTMSELVALQDVVLLGPVPSEILPIKATTTAAITKNSSVSREATALIQFLRSPASMAVFKAKGFEAN
jgi:molybdate transport system substrate-binding protein